MNQAAFLLRQIFHHPPPLPKTLNLDGQTILITGANSGVGLEAARHVVRLGAEILILAVRTVSKGEAAKSDILKSCPSSKTKIQVWELEMESLESVAAFGQRAQELPRLDIAMLNAGIMLFEWKRSTETGYETMLQVNHISTALLSLLLLPVLQKTSADLKKPSRITFTSSEMHMWTPFKERKAANILAQMNDEQFQAAAMDRYAVTKLLNVLWITELGSRLRAEDVVVNCVDPGLVKTGLHRTAGGALRVFDRVFAWEPEEGGRLVVDAAVVKGRETHQKFILAAKSTDPTAFIRSAEGKKVQKKLWAETMKVFQDKLPSVDLSVVV